MRLLAATPVALPGTSVVASVVGSVVGAGGSVTGATPVVNSYIWSITALLTLTSSALSRGDGLEH